MTTTNDQWAPLEIGDDEIETFTALREDVPDYLYRSLWLWIWDRFTTSKTTLGDRFFNVDLARTCERVLKISIADVGTYDDDSFRAVQQAVEGGSHILVWRLVDFLASRLTHRGFEADLLTQLDTMLVQSGSAWQVGQRQEKPGLSRRMPEGVGDAAQAAFQKPRSGSRLRVA